MLYHLLFALRDQVSVLNVTRYITFRTTVAALTALFLVLLLGPWMIERLRRLQIGQQIRETGPEAHHAKAGTPTMGGVLILLGILVPTLLWADLTNTNVQIVVLATVAFGLIGFADDYIKVVRKQSLGLRAAQKLVSTKTDQTDTGGQTFLHNRFILNSIGSEIHKASAADILDQWDLQTSSKRDQLAQFGFLSEAQHSKIAGMNP